MLRVIVLVFFAFVSHVQADGNWPRFRGVDGTGVSPDNSNLPLSWTTTENVAWVADVPGWGWSCPVVWEDKVFLTTVVSDEANLTPSKGLYLGEGVRDPAKGVHHWMTYCFDLTTGEEVWKQESHVGTPKVPRHPKSTYAAETPATDGERLYVLFGDLGLYCYSLNGNLLWSQKIEPKKTAQDYGAAASPVVHDGQVFVVYDNREESWIASFDAKTGDERWRKPRDETHSWATPLVWKNDVRTEIVVPGKNLNRSYALNGDVLWEFDGRMSNLVIPSPFTAHGLCYIASGYVGDDHRPTFAVKPGGRGNLVPDGKFENSESIAWYQGKSSPYNPSQIVYGDYLYTQYDRGFLTCHDAKTGVEIYGKRRFTPGGSFTSSPWAYNGHLFFLNEDGLTYVVKAGPEFEIVGRNDLQELSMACPAAVGDKLLIRTASKLYCLTEGAKVDPAVVAKMQPRRAATTAENFWAAAREGKQKTVARLLASGMSVDARQGGRGATALNTAAVFDQTEVARLLIVKGADVSIANQDGNTALHIACFFGNEELVALLLSKGAAPTAKNGRGDTPLGSMSVEWSEQLEGTYNGIGRQIGRELDLERIKATRQKILTLLQQADKQNGQDIWKKTARKMLHTAIESGDVAGGSHLVVHQNSEAYFDAAGVRDIQSGEPFRADTILRVYSMTKPITSVTAMTLFERGKFQLDDPVSKFIPAFEKTTVLVKDGDSVEIIPARRQITIRDVFRHTTGFNYGGGSVEEYYKREGMKYRSPAGMYPPAMNIEKAAAALARIPALYHPGERFTYGFNTDLLGRLIEVWSDQRLSDYMQQAVLGPLQMEDSGFSIPKEKRNRFASCHTKKNGKLAIIDKAATSPFADGFAFESGGGGLLSTLRDYEKFCRMMVNGGQLNGQRVLKQETIDLMFTNQLGDVPGDFEFGLGFAIKKVELGSGDQKRQVMQYSWSGYASTDFRLVPEEKLLQIFVRQRVPSAGALAEKVFPVVYEGL